ncbi:MAG: hypothetical protein IPM45_14100 [Acidimicrobiales bacterium]|nr:hypothetical protein [Acidimicrobiales bacterium]
MADVPTQPTPAVGAVYGFLRQRGASDAEIRAAGHGRWLAGLVLERAVLPGARRWTLDDVAAEAGVSVEVATRLWRAMGFPDVDVGERVFTDYDVTALQATVQRLASRDAGVEDAVQQTRVIAGALARVAEVWVDTLIEQAKVLRHGQADIGAAALELVDRLDLDQVAPVLDYVHRRQIIAALARRFTWGDDPLEGDTHLAVGFADLAGFTSLSQELTDDELGELVQRFEAVTHDVIAERGGRLVKTIGDEVMFVAPDAGAGAEISVGLIEAHADDDLLPDVRVGLDVGSLLVREGDYFGDAVNRASRLVGLARRGSVVVPSDLRDELRDDPRFRCSPIGPRRVKDFGAIWLWSLRRAPAA